MLVMQKGRIPKNGKMSKHIQIEAIMSLAGANADKRIPLTVAQQKQALVELYNAVTGSAVSTGLNNKDVAKAAQQLKASGSKGVVVSGLDDFDAQLVVLAINIALRSEAFNPIDAKLVRKGDAKAVNQLVAEMNAGKSSHTYYEWSKSCISLPNSKEFRCRFSKKLIYLWLFQLKKMKLLKS